MEKSIDDLLDMTISLINNSTLIEDLIGLLEKYYSDRIQDRPTISIKNAIDCKYVWPSSHEINLSSIILDRLINLVSVDEYIDIAQKYIRKASDYAYVINSLVRDKKVDLILRLMPMNKKFMYVINIHRGYIEDEYWKEAVIHGFTKWRFIGYHDIEFYLSENKAEDLVKIYGTDIIMQFGGFVKSYNNLCYPNVNLWRNNLEKVINGCIIHVEGHNLQYIVHNIWALIDNIYSLNKFIGEKSNTQYEMYINEIFDMFSVLKIMGNVSEIILKTIIKYSDIDFLRKIDTISQDMSILNILMYNPDAKIRQYFIEEKTYDANNIEELAKYICEFAEIEDFKNIEKIFINKDTSKIRVNFKAISSVLSDKIKYDNYGFLFEINKYTFFNEIIFDENVLIDTLKNNTIVIDTLINMKYKHFTDKLLEKILEKININIAESSIYLFQNCPYLLASYYNEDAIIVYDFLKENDLDIKDNIMLNETIDKCNDKLFQALILRMDINKNIYENLIFKIDLKYNELKDAKIDTSIITRLCSIRKIVMDLFENKYDEIIDYISEYSDYDDNSENSTNDTDSDNIDSDNIDSDMDN